MPKLLLVEDDPESVETFRFLFKNLELSELVIAGSVEEALSYCSPNRFDVVISDYHLGERLGTEVARAYYPTPTIIVTGDASVDPAIESVRAKAAWFLPKPFRLADFLEALKYALENNHEELERLVLYLNHRFRVRGASSLRFRDARQTPSGTSASPEPSQALPAAIPRRTRRGPGQ